MRGEFSLKGRFERCAIELYKSPHIYYITPSLPKGITKTSSMSSEEGLFSLDGQLGERIDKGGH